MKKLGRINFLSNKSLISFLQYSSNPGFICIGLALVCFSKKYFLYGKETICCFLFQKAFGIGEHIYDFQFVFVFAKSFLVIVLISSFLMSFYIVFLSE